jgi:hypothetical protein
VRRLTAAVLAAAAAAIAGVVASASVDQAVRAEVAVAGKGNPLDVRRIRVVEGLRPGESYRLPAFGIRNHRGVPTAYRLVVFAGPAQLERRPPRRWLRFLPPAVVIDARQSRAVGVRLQLPHDAEPGVYALALGVRPGSSDGVRLTFRIEPAESSGAWVRQAADLATWAVPTLFGLALVVLAVRIRARARPTDPQRGSSAPPPERQAAQPRSRSAT